MQLNTAFLNINSSIEHQISQLKLKYCFEDIMTVVRGFILLFHFLPSAKFQIQLDVHRTAFVVPTILHSLCKCSLKG